MIPNVHDPEYWHEELQPLLADLDFALRVATPKAHAVFTDHLQKPVNRPLLSNLIRYFVLEYLRSRGHSASDIEDPDSWGLRGLPNNGIEIIYKRSCIRIRKGIDPPCPNTQAQRDFYQQRLWEDDGEDAVATNLIVLWNLGLGLLYEGDMKLVRPLKGNAKWVRLEWSKQVIVLSVDPDAIINSEYSRPSELPLQRDGIDERTGTDGDGD